MTSVVVDANVLVSFFLDRDEKQRAAAKALLLEAVDGEIEAIIPQFVVTRYQRPQPGCSSLVSCPSPSSLGASVSRW